MATIALQQGTGSWHLWRRKGIGATDAAAICGYSKWDSALSVYLKKTITEQPKVEQNTAQEWGTRIEPILVDKLIDDMQLDPNWIVRGRLFMDDWKRCSLDAEYSNPIKNEGFIIECKTARNVLDWNPVPQAYYAQVQWQMLVTGYKKAIFSVLANGIDWLSREVEYDEAFATDMCTKCKNFWFNHVEPRVFPPQTTSCPEADLDALAQIKADGEKGNISKEISEELFTKYIVAKENFQKATELYERIKTEVAYNLIDADYVMFDGKKVVSSVSRVGTESIDKKLLKENYPEVYNAVIKKGMGCTYLKFM